MPNHSRILLVEDDPDTQDGLYRLLSREGYTALDPDDLHVVADAVFRKLIDPKVLLATIRRLMTAQPGEVDWSG